MKAFDKYDLKEVKVEDEGLKNVVFLDDKLVIKSHGRLNTDKFGRIKVNIIERFVNLISVPGHRGKKQKIQTKHATGKYYKNMKMALSCFEIIQDKTGKNPIQIFIKAIENAAPREEVTTIEYGGARYPQAVDTSPLRRINVALRNLVHAGYDKSFNKKIKIQQGLASEIIAASENSGESAAIKKKNELEKQADSAR